MPDDELPDDMAEWPADPYQLLGVSRNADKRAARQAYLRLVRRFKPEHASRQFQRIREAFEQVQLSIKSHSKHINRLGDAFDPTEEATATDGLLETRPVPVRADPVEPADHARAWNMARLGDDSGAYEMLLRTHEKKAANTDTYLRLYWILVCRPELDSDRAPCDWLIQGLRRDRLRGRLAELYRRELEANPKEATTSRCHALLEVPADVGAVADLVHWRWMAAGRLGRWEIIAGDLPHVRQLIAFDDESVWARMTIMAIQRLVWFAGHDRAKAALDSCRQELEQLVHLHASLETELDELELLEEIASRISAMRKSAVPNAVCNLIQRSWLCPFWEIRQELLAELDRIAMSPRKGLRQLDRIGKVCGSALARLEQLTESFRDERNDHYPDDGEVQRRARRFLYLKWGNYEKRRPDLVEFCVREALAPETLCRLVDVNRAFSRNDDASWTEDLADDAALRFVYHACRTVGG